MTAPAPRFFGTLPDGREVTAHTLATPGGLSLRVLDLGAAVQALHLPGPAGRRIRLAGGRCAAEPDAVSVEGDPELGARVLAVLATTP